MERKLARRKWKSTDGWIDKLTTVFAQPRHIMAVRVPSCKPFVRCSRPNNAAIKAFRAVYIMRNRMTEVRVTNFLPISFKFSDEANNEPAAMYSVSKYVSK